MASENTTAPKRLVVCCDGTWNTPEMESPTNVVRLAGNVQRQGEDGLPQLLYYDEGVGTGGWMDRLVGGAFGEGLDTNVREAYRFIANNHAEGDEIYLFGFSRGAYTVRSLAGMIGYAGLLGRDQMHLVAEAYELYRKEKSANGDEALAFRSRHDTSVPEITLMGCWDTVGALGIPNKLPRIPLDKAFTDRYRWLDFKLGEHVRAALHAVSIDERRKEFEHTPMYKGSPDQVLHEVWFAGDHGCVGGGTKHKEPLSRIALEWMVEQLGELGLDLAVDGDFRGLSDPDHNIYFDVNRSPIYGRAWRDLGVEPILHPSAIDRYHDLPNYRESLDASQRTALDAAVRDDSGSLNLSPSELGIGESAHAIVNAREHRNDTGIDFVGGARYRLSVPPTQCWRDGKLPVCDAAGWHENDPVVQSAPGRLAKAKRMGLRMFQRGLVVAEADWFELVAIVNGADGREHTLRVGMEVEFEAPFDGRLWALANDFESRVPLADRYANNEGWVVLEVTRTA